ncbi:MAG TPA: hypothetical protein VGL00_05035 [Terracidiphilus sp.]
MNRYSLMFALLVASSFAVQGPQAGEGTSAPATAAKPAATDSHSKVTRPVGHDNAAEKQGGVPFVQAFLAKALDKGGPGQGPAILFATVPHPLETHLASKFDHDLDALQDGLQDSGYLYDSSWIPWKAHGQREQYKDDENEASAKAAENGSPGILLFRNSELAPLPKQEKDPYRNGAVVFVITEKPTQGIALAQVKAAVEIAQKSGLPMPATIQILGPTFSGSFATLVRMTKLLGEWDAKADVVIRSGGVSVGDAACQAMEEISQRLPGRSIHFGSAMHDHGARVAAVLNTLQNMGMDVKQVAVLAEEESLYGFHSLGGEEPSGKSPSAQRDDKDLHRMWRLAFPRDISSLRAGYQAQGIFGSHAPAEPWKRLLNLHSEEQGEGDTIRSFGGASTVTSQEGILLGISEFLRKHHVRAVLISATNHDDLYFLAQFLHAHNSAIRVVMLGNSRTFVRELDGEFRGDLIVDEYPMMPWLGDWTGDRRTGTRHFFADDVAQGTYFAVRDLFHQAGAAAPGWIAEYSMPFWKDGAEEVLEPPVYLAALGSKSTWPVGVVRERAYPDPKGDVEMPFRLFGSAPRHGAPAEKIRPGTMWKLCLAALVFLTAGYSACFWIADPVQRIVCASFQPSCSWRFWLLKVTIPAAVAAAAFEVLAWSVEIPEAASASAGLAWRYAEGLTLGAPLAVGLSAVIKAVTLAGIPLNPRMALAGLPFVGAAVLALAQGRFARDPFAGQDASWIMNKFREMRLESGLSLVPTLLLLLAALMVWAVQAGNGNALLEAAPPLPDYPENPRISRLRGENIARAGKPLPAWRVGKVTLIAWGLIAMVVLFFHESRSFTMITTLEWSATTRLVLGISVTVVLLLLLDLVQFVALWEELRGLLRALHREKFRRSFVPITEFKWPALWSFSGVSFRDRKALDWALAQCVFEMHCQHAVGGLGHAARGIKNLKLKYSREPLQRKTVPEFKQDRKEFFDCISHACKVAAVLMEANKYGPARTALPADSQPPQRPNSKAEGNTDPFCSEREEASRLSEPQQAAERLICLLYIGFIQTVVARLHTLLMSVAAMFSLLVVAMAIYPFVPFAPLLLSGCALLAAVGWAFMKVFSELDRDAILSRIVNKEEGKLRTNFYLKLAEALALPMLALASSVLPGGTGRILELLSSLLNHAQ